MDATAKRAKGMQDGAKDSECRGIRTRTGEKGESKAKAMRQTEAGQATGQPTSIKPCSSLLVYKTANPVTGKTRGGGESLKTRPPSRERKRVRHNRSI